MDDKLKTNQPSQSQKPQTTSSIQDPKEKINVPPTSPISSITRPEDVTLAKDSLLQPPTQTPLSQTPQPSLRNAENQIDLKIEQPSQKKGSTGFGKILAVFLIIIILLVGGSSLTLAYTNYELLTPPKIVQRVIDRVILITPLPKTPRLILRRTQRKMATLKSTSLETQIEFKTESANFPISSAKITVKGPAEFTSQNYSKTQLEISSEVAMEGMQFSASGEIRQIEDNLYFRLTEFPGGSFLSLNDIKNQWFVVNVEQLNLEKRTLEDEQRIQKIQEIFEAFIERTYTWTTVESTGDKSVYTLKIKPPVSEINDLIFEIIETVEPMQQTELQKSIRKEEIEKITKDIKNIEFTLKIDKSDSLIREASILFVINIDAPTNLFSQSQSITLAPTTTIPFSLNIATKFSDYDKTVIIEIPQDAKDLTQYLEQFEQSLKQLSPTPQLPNLPQQSPPQTPDDDIGELRNLLKTPSPVLGKSTYWDLVLWDTFGQIF